MIRNERKWGDMKGCERKMKDLKKRRKCREMKEMEGHERKLKQMKGNRMICRS